MPQIVRIGMRSSSMARLQTTQVQQELVKLHPEFCFQQLEISTRGDRDRQRALAEFKRPGIFTSGLERALREKEIDLAVHSFKDLPTEMHPDLVIGAVTAREDPADVLVTKTGLGFEHLEAGARIGTSSPRRQRLLVSLGRRFQCVQVRGNIDTRIRQMDEDSTCEALMVAVCGLERLGLADRVSYRFDVSKYFTAPAQGALALQCRAADPMLGELLAPLNHIPTQQCTNAERSLLVHLGGGCALAVAALSQLIGEKIILQAAILSPDGQRRIYSSAANSDPDRAAAAVAADMIAQGCLAWL